MKLEDRIFDECLGKAGYLYALPYYKTTERNGIMELFYPVVFDKDPDAIVLAKAEDVRLEEIPQVAQFMIVQVSLNADTEYYGMSGRVVEHNDESAKVRLFGYQKPLTFKIGDLEPLTDGGDLECWLDSLLDVKEY